MILYPNKMNKFEGKMTRDAIKIISLLNFSPKIIFDIGANIGLYSLSFSKSCPCAKIYSFEPVKNTYDIFINNIDLNKCNNIQAFNYGIYKETKKIIMGIPCERKVKKNKNIGLYTTKHNGEIENIVECDFIKFDNIIKNLDIDTIDLIKIDIEGCEYDVLSSSNRILSMTKFIHFEYNNNFSDSLKIKELLLNNNFSYMVNTRKSNQLWKKGDI